MREVTALQTVRVYWAKDNDRDHSGLNQRFDVLKEPGKVPRTGQGRAALTNKARRYKRARRGLGLGSTSELDFTASLRGLRSMLPFFLSLTVLHLLSSVALPRGRTQADTTTIHCLQLVNFINILG